MVAHSLGHTSQLSMERVKFVEKKVTQKIGSLKLFRSSLRLDLLMMFLFSLFSLTSLQQLESI